MRNFLTVVFIILVCLSGVAWYLKPSKPQEGVVRITYLTPLAVSRYDRFPGFNQLDPKIQLKPEFANKWSDLTTMSKIIMQCSTGVGPDLFDSDASRGLQSFVESGVAEDITEAAKAGGFGKDQMWPGLEEGLFINGRQYAYPGNAGTTVLIYNKNIFDDFKVPYPTENMTWDECFDLAKRVTRLGTRQDETVYGLISVGYQELFNSQRGQYFSENGSLVLLNSDVMKKSWQIHHDLRFKYKITPTDLVLQNLSSQGGESAATSLLSLMADGRIAIINIGNYSATVFRILYEAQEKKLKQWNEDPNHDPGSKPRLLRIGSVKLPHFSGLPPCYRLSTRCVVINSKSRHKEQAYKLLKYLAGPAYCAATVMSNDQLPGNPSYARFHSEPTIPDLSEAELFNNTVEAMKYTYMPRKSRFLLSAEVSRIIGQQVSRLEANPGLKVDDLLNEAQSMGEEMMQITIDRNPDLKQEYIKITGTGNVHEAHQNLANKH